MGVWTISLQELIETEPLFPVADGNQSFNLLESDGIWSLRIQVADGKWESMSQRLMGVLNPRELMGVVVLYLTDFDIDW